MSVLISFLPSGPVVVQDLHLKSFASLGDFVTGVSHSNDPQSRPCDLDSHQALRYVGSLWVQSYLVT